jgi:hypothetical protein
MGKVLVLIALWVLVSTSLVRAEGNVSKASAIFVTAESAFMHKESSWTGPLFGVRACAYMVSRIIQSAVDLRKGFVITSVPALEHWLRTLPSVTPVSLHQAKPGDIVVQGDQEHVGVCARAGCSMVISNSSHKRCFCYADNPYFSLSYKSRTPPRIYHFTGVAQNY